MRGAGPAVGRRGRAAAPDRAAIVAYPSLVQARSVFLHRPGKELLVVEKLINRVAPAQLAPLEAHVQAEAWR